jgi:hypothetical protein
MRLLREVGFYWTLPREVGFYWAKWRIAAEGTRDRDEFIPSDEWEVVEVFENSSDEREDEHFVVHVCGVEKGQSIKNFLWDDGPLVAPGGDVEDRARPRYTA